MTSRRRRGFLCLPHEHVELGPELRGGAIDERGNPVVDPGVGRRHGVLRRLCCAPRIIDSAIAASQARDGLQLAPVEQFDVLGRCT